MKTELLTNNYLFVPEFIHPDDAKNLARAFEQYTEKNNVPGDSQIPESSSVYNFPDFQELLCAKIANVGWLIEENVLPTYAYARVYKNGAELHCHKDRGACEISVTLNLDQDNESWPIFIKKQNGETARVVLRPGDAMLYLGCQAEHWREPFKGQKHTQVFLHYVRSRGPNARFAFDKNRDETPCVDPIVQTQQELVVCKEKPFVADLAHVKELEKYVVKIDNVLDKSLCEQILKEYANDQEWVQALVGDGKEAPEVRGALTISMSRPEVVERNAQVRKALDEAIYKRVAEALKKYNEYLGLVNFSVSHDTGYELLKYLEGTGYTEHTDDFMQEPRVVSCSLLLNDEFEGGDFSFFKNSLSIKQSMGSALFFPSSFMFPHQVNKVTKGTRYSIVTWFR